MNVKPTLLSVLMAALLALALGFGGCKPEENALAVDHLPENTPVVAEPVRRISENRVVFVSGTLEADKTSPLGFLVPGRVDRVLVDEGDRVGKGGLLAVIDAQDYQNRLDMAEASVLRAKDAYERYEPLYREGAFAEKKFIELKAGLAEAVAARNIARKALKETRLFSPISGIVGQKFIEIGQMTSSRSRAFTIVKTDVVHARVSVPESEIHQLMMANQARVVVPALEGRSFTGLVSMIGAVADERTRTYAVKIQLQNPDFILKTGMMVKAEIRTETKLDMLAVPGAAIVRDADELTYVFIVDPKSGAAVRKRVLPGRAYRDLIEIREGVDPVDTIVVSGQNKLTDGTPVTVLKPQDG